MSAKTKLVRVFNRGLGTYVHNEHRIAPGSFADVPEEVAKIWCDIHHYGAQQVVMGSDIPAATIPEPDVEKELLTEENKALQERIANLEKLLNDAKKGSADSKKSSNPLA